MIPTSHFEEEVLPKVLANENAARLMLRTLVGRGVTISVPESDMTHEDVIECLIQIVSELKRREQ